MICRAKFSDRCYRCGLEIRPGQMIDYKGWRGQSRHATCQTEQEAAIAPYDAARERYVSPTTPPVDHEPSRESRGETVPCLGCKKPLRIYRDTDDRRCPSCREDAKIALLLHDYRTREENERIFTDAVRDWFARTEPTDGGRSLRSGEPPEQSRSGGYEPPTAVCADPKGVT